jgi:hypothetical protein
MFSLLILLVWDIIQNPHLQLPPLFKCRIKSLLTMQGMINHFSQFIKIDSTKFHLQIVTIIFEVQYWRTIIYTLRQIVQNKIIQIIYLHLVTNQNVIIKFNQNAQKISCLFCDNITNHWILSFACLATLVLLVAPILRTTIFIMEYTMSPS